MPVASTDAAASYRFHIAENGRLSKMALGISSHLPPTDVVPADDDDDDDNYASNLAEQIACAMLDDDEMSALKKEDSVASRSLELCPDERASHFPVINPQVRSSGIWSNVLSGNKARYVPLYHNDTEVSYLPQTSPLSMACQTASRPPYRRALEAELRTHQALAAAVWGDEIRAPQGLCRPVNTCLKKNMLRGFLQDAGMRAGAQFAVRAPISNDFEEGILMAAHVRHGDYSNFLSSSTLPVKVDFGEKLGSDFSNKSAMRSSALAFGSARMARREAAGTGVFLPRVHTSNAAQRRRQFSPANASTRTRSGATA